MASVSFVRFNIVTEIMQATTINNLKRARGMKLTQDRRPQGSSKGDLLQVGAPTKQSSASLGLGHFVKFSSQMSERRVFFRGKQFM